VGRPILRTWFRAEIHGLDAFPTEGGALVVSNHAGGILTPDVLLFGSAFYGADRDRGTVRRRSR
jgi:1-acyl-sn-glycerol-3-phosphate acyltransferase